MANPMLRSLRRVSSLLNRPPTFRPVLKTPQPIFTLLRPSSQLHQNTLNSCRVTCLWQRRSFTHGSLHLVISPQGKPKFETHEIEPPKKEKWKTKKRLKLQRKREKQKRKAANKRDPRRLGVKGKKKRQRFSSAEERIKYKLENARVKEALLIERLKRYEVPKAQGPEVEPHVLTGEERFYMKKMAQKRSNYVPVGRRGIFGGVILNMHLHWKKHETVKVICKPCKPGQVQEYANEIARLSGGIPIQIIGDDTIIFYRGKNYVQPEVMSPVDTLSKKRALEKSKYEQSLESVRRFIAIAEKELELYYRHVALYGDPNDRDPKSILDHRRTIKGREKAQVTNNSISPTEGKSSGGLSAAVDGSDDEELFEFEDTSDDESKSSSDLDCEDVDMLSDGLVSSDDIADDNSFFVQESAATHDYRHKLNSNINILQKV
ncbi:putative CRM domain-containing protein, chloroplastic [Sesamum alatum]|uniref:CRM domain-containing protein, chloroplastic n=1 Tax=Sesamum alatum TaxID=300844 RepID=A0AAE2CR62_9LAMI|nr:putative CRM domain-containing protein, chloroplastic [Sesamum alatum]